jgi:hypothetical protein
MAACFDLGRVANKAEEQAYLSPRTVSQQIACEGCVNTSLNINARNPIANPSI